MRLFPLLSSLLLFLGLLGCAAQVEQAPLPQKKTIASENSKQTRMAGLNFTAPSSPFPANPMPAIQAVNANWIAVLPYGYTKLNDNKVHYNIDWQWWGEKKVGAAETIRLAKEAGIKVLLKPQVYIPSGWVGQLDFSKERDWAIWEATYSEFILDFAKMAAEMEVEMFCVGVEFEIGVRKREAYWRNLIQEVRAIYSGKVIYAANWDGFEKVPFWDALDFVGINAYFPLIDDVTPSVKALKAAWKKPLEQISDFQAKIDKPIIFPEFGYLSVDGCAYQTWELEKKIRSLAINEQAQANAYQAFFEVFSAQEWWKGGFLWKWFPNLQGHEGYRERDYTPQHKQAEKVLTEWFGKL